jgi:hypothetical protein
MMVDRETYKFRMKTCRGCNEYQKHFPKICGICNCFMPVKAKFKNNKCPSDKWTSV